MLSGAMISLATLFSYTLSLHIPDVSQKVVASIIFPFGLISIVYLKAKLFTGAVVKLSNNDMTYMELFKIYIGNMIGVVVSYLIVSIPNSNIVDALSNVAVAKISMYYVNIFINSILCNIMVCLAVILLNRATSDFGKIAMCMLCISPMVFCGFEHCVANMFVFMSIISPDNIMPIIIHMTIVSIGNLFGGIIISKGVKYGD